MALLGIIFFLKIFHTDFQGGQQLLLCATCFHFTERLIKSRTKNITLSNNECQYFIGKKVSKTCTICYF